MSTHLLDRVRACGSSFYWGIRLLPVAERTAMAALYLYCRAVDDVADGTDSASEKIAALKDWRDCLSAPERLCPDPALGRPLATAIHRFNLPRELFEAVVDGVAMDMPPGLEAPPLALLEDYCHGVAGAVGLLTVRILGCSDGAADRFAEVTGQALQFTNILRDVAEDADIGRLYLPAEVLDSAGIATRDPAAVLAHPALPDACAAFATIAEQRFADATACLRTLDWRRRWKLRTAVALMALYRRVLDRLQDRGWTRLRDRPRLGRLEVIGLILRHRLLGAS